VPELGCSRMKGRMTMADLLLLDEVAESLDRFADTRLDGAGAGVAAASGYGAAGWAVGSVNLRAAEWDPVAGTWGRELRIDLLDERRDEPLRVRCLVPWLLDDEARAAAPPGAVLGGHAGLWARGRARVPACALVRSPGVHLAVRALEGREPELVLTLAAGLAGTCAVTVPDGSGPVVRGTGRFADFPQLPSHGALVDQLVARLGGRVPLFPASVIDATAGRTLGADRPDAGTDRLTAADLAALLDRLNKLAPLVAAATSPADLPAGVVTELDPAVWALAFYGDTLVRAVARAAAATVGRRARQEAAIPPAALALQASANLRRRVEAVAVGRGAYATHSSAHALRNCVDRAEAHRRVTLIGPDALPRLRGRMDLRCLPAAWRRELCPVTTPESPQVGLVRHFALGHGTGADEPALQRHTDLGLAASLIPFVGHDDPTRASIVAKMFGQALVVSGAEPPVVRTGTEQPVADAVGTVRAAAPGRVRRVGRSEVVVGEARVAFGPPGHDGSGQEGAWLIDVAEGGIAAAGQVVAHAPDVAVDPGTGLTCLQLGLNALVALLPWHGWNYEDGIVVSRSFCERAASEHVVALAADFGGDPDDVVLELVPPQRLGSPLPAGEPLLALSSPESTKVLGLPERGSLLPAPPGSPFAYTRLVAREDSELHVRYRTRRTLVVGDKLTTRHGGKGVVTRIVPDEEMPLLPDGSRVEVLLNPVGVLRRLNAGTVFELNVALARRLAGEEAARTVPRALRREGRAALAAELEALGAPGGRLRLHAADGTALGPAEGAVVGDLYLLKLDHLASAKLSSRADAGPSPVTWQPARRVRWVADRRAGAPQRLGEMEMWGLHAIGATAAVADLHQVRGEGHRTLRARRTLPAGLRAAAALLAVAGVCLEAVTSSGERVDLPAEPFVDPAQVIGVGLRWGGEDPPGGGLRDVMELEAGILADARTSGLSERALAVQLLRRVTGRAASFETPESRQAQHWAVYLEGPVPHPWVFGRARQVALPDLRVLRVPPPAALPELPHGGWDRALQRVVERNLLLRRAHRGNDAAAVAEAQRALTAAVHELLGSPDDEPSAGTLAGRLSGKYGLLRRHVLGASAVRSGRGVMTADPDRPVETVGLPRTMLDDLGIPGSPQGAEDVVLVDRSPTLHPYSLVALRASASDDATVRLHPYLLKAIAGDFDGDTIAVHRAADEAARAQLWELCRPASATRSAVDGGLLAKLDLDVTLGWYLLEGTAVVPATLAVRALEQRGLDGAPDVDRVAAVMRAGWDAAMGWGFSLVDLPTATTSGVAGILDGPGPGRRIAEARAAGAAGTDVDLEQLLVARGVAVPPHPLLPRAEVRGCYLDGLADEDYFAAAQPSIGALAAKKLVTPHAGALTRELVWLGYGTRIAAGDCGAAEPRSPLGCRIADPERVCARCYGADRARPGTAIPPGRRVGILAAMVVGERSTQAAMKSIHRRGRQASLTGAVSRLRDVFRGHVADDDGADARDVFAPALAEFTALLPTVDLVHAEVLLRVLVQRGTAGVTRREPGDVAAGRPALTRAIWSGRLRQLVVAARSGAGPEPPDALLQDLGIGMPS
jgi:RNA polymerase Rpb2, domain 6/RNA polymerase Rpb1, domain 2